jgi:hypothetical protein
MMGSGRGMLEHNWRVAVDRITGTFVNIAVSRLSTLLESHGRHVARRSAGGGLTISYGKPPES